MLLHEHTIQYALLASSNFFILLHAVISYMENRRNRKTTEKLHAENSERLTTIETTITSIPAVVASDTVLRELTAEHNNEKET